MGGGPMGGMGAAPMGNLMNLNAAPVAPNANAGFGTLDPLAMLNSPPAAAPKSGGGMQLGGVKKVQATKGSAGDWDNW